MGEVRKKTNNISYYMYNKDHPPPHVHIYFGNSRSPEQAAKLAIDDQRVLAGSLRGKVMKEAAAWIKANTAELNRMWNNREQPGGIYTISR